MYYQSLHLVDELVPGFGVRSVVHRVTTSNLEATVQLKAFLPVILILQFVCSVPIRA